MQRGLEVVLALKMGFAGILNGQSALARADIWIGWCSMRNSLRHLCLYLLSMTYDPPHVTPTPAPHGKEIIYLAREGLLREMDYAFVV